MIESPKLPIRKAKGDMKPKTFSRRGITSLGMTKEFSDRSTSSNTTTATTPTLVAIGFSARSNISTISLDPHIADGEIESASIKRDAKRRKRKRKKRLPRPHKFRPTIALATIGYKSTKRGNQAPSRKDSKNLSRICLRQLSTPLGDEGGCETEKGRLTTRFNSLSGKNDAREDSSGENTKLKAAADSMCYDLPSENVADRKSSDVNTSALKTRSATNNVLGSQSNPQASDDEELIGPLLSRLEGRALSPDDANDEEDVGKSMLACDDSVFSSSSIFSFSSMVCGCNLMKRGAKKIKRIRIKASAAPLSTKKQIGEKSTLSSSTDEAGKACDSRDAHIPGSAVKQMATLEPEAASLEDLEKMAKNKHNLGILNMNTGQYNKAHVNFREALHARQLLFGNDHPAVSSTRSRLGDVSMHLGRYKSARQHLAAELLLHDDLSQEKAIVNLDFEERVEPLGVIDESPVCSIHDSVHSNEQYESHRETALEYFANAISALEDGKEEGQNNYVPRIHIKMGYSYLRKAGYDILVENFTETLMDRERDDSIFLTTGTTCIEMGDHDLAMSFLEIALRRKRTYLGDDHRDVATVLRHIGTIHQHKDEDDQALECYSTAWSILKQIEDEVNDMFHVCESMVSVYKKRGHAEEVIKCYEELLSISDDHDLLGDHHEKIARICYHLGLIYKETDQTLKAMRYFKKEGKIRSTLGNDTRATSGVLMRIGAIYIEQGKHQKAMRYFWNALRYFIGEDGNTVDETAAFKADKGNLKNTLEQCESLVRNDILVPEPTNNAYIPVAGDVADTLHDMGNIYLMDGLFEAAISSYECCLRITKMKDEFDSLEMVKTKFNLVKALCARELYDQALEMLEDILCAQTQSTGKEFSETGNTRNEMGNCYMKKQSYYEAFRCYKEALAIKRKTFDDNHKEVVGTMYNTGMALFKLEEYESAARYFFNVLHIQREGNGWISVDVSSTLSMLGVIHRKKKLHHLALSYFEDAKSCLENAEFEVSNPKNASRVEKMKEELRHILSNIKAKEESTAKRQIFARAC